MNLFIPGIAVILISIFVVQESFAGPFDRFRERLRQLRGEVPAPVQTPAPVQSPAPVQTPAPVQAPNYNVTFNNTIWKGVISITAPSLSQYKSNIEQDYKVTKPTFSAPVEVWFPTETTWLLVLDLAPLKNGGDRPSQTLSQNDGDWGEVIGSAPQAALLEISDGGLVSRAAVLEGYDGEGNLDKNLKTFSGTRDRTNRPDGFVSCAGSYTFVGAESNPTMVVTGTATSSNQNEDGFRIQGAATFEIRLQKASDRTVSTDIFKRGGFKSKDWWGWDPGVRIVVEQGQVPPI